MDNCAMASEPMLTPEEFAHAVNLSERTVYRHIARGRIAAVRVGRVWRIPRSQLDLLRALAGDVPNMRAPRARTMRG